MSLRTTPPTRSCPHPPPCPAPSPPAQPAQPMLARVPREVSDAWHDRVPARLHLAWRVKRRGAMKSAHWAPPQRGCTAPPLQGPNPTPNPNPTQHGHGSRCPRSPGSASGQRGGASSRRCPAPPLPVLLRRHGTCEPAACRGSRTRCCTRQKPPPRTGQMPPRRRPAPAAAPPTS